MLDNILKSKRRRAIRYAIEIEALLLFEKSQSIPCIILDFCNSGFFVGFKDSTPEIPLHKSISIKFSINSEPVRQAFEIEAKVVHIMSTGLGIGVEIEYMPFPALNALTSAANTGLKSILPKHHRLSKNELNQLNFKNAFKIMLFEKLSLLIVGFYGYMADDLEKADKNANYFTNRSVFDDFITNLKINQDSLVSEFCILVVSQLDYISDFSQKRDSIFTVDTPLSVVEKEDFEDWLSISDVIRKLTSHFEDQINQLIRELCRVFGLTRSTVTNPISPAILCESFRETILSLKLDKQSNKLLYRSFSQTLFNSLGSLYQQVELILSKQESAEKKIQYTPYQSPRFSESDLFLADQPVVNSESILGQRSQQLILNSDNKVFDQVDSTKHLDRKPVLKIVGKLLDILNEVDEDSLEFFHKNLLKDKVNADQVHAEFRPDEVITAISKIQNDFQKDSNLDLESIDIRKRLLEVLEGLGNGSKSLSRNEVHQLEIYGKFFETLFNDQKLSGEFKSYLKKIQLPLLSLPFKGDDFLGSNSNSVRNILNQLAFLEPVIKSNKTIQNINVKNELDRLVSRIHQESNTNPEVFIEVEQELGNITKLINKSIDSNVNRIIQAYDGQQKLEVARRFIQSEIDNRIANTSVPEVLILLLESGWQHLLVVAELNKEKNKQEDNKYLKVFDDLIFWFNEQESELKVQTSTIQKTIEFIRENLISVCTNVTERRIIIDELTAQLLGDVAKARKSIKTVKIEPVSQEGNIPGHELDQYWAQVEQLQVGEWLMMISDSQESVPMKLIWIGEVVQLYVIFNQDGFSKIEFNKAELVERFKSGMVSKIEHMDEPVVDRATHLMLQEMHEKLINNATHDPETNLLNKVEFIKQMKHELSKPSDTERMLCHLEVLDFRIINTVCGFAAGSQLMRKIAQLIKEQLNSDEVVARIGDKTFAILFKQSNAVQSHDLANKLINFITNKHFEWQEKSFPTTVSIGLVPIKNNNYDVHELLQQADTASMSAERSGPNNILVFNCDDELLKYQNKLYEWIGHIDNVFSQNRLFIRCQKIASIDPSNNHYQHYEILLGIRDEDGNIIYLRIILFLLLNVVNE